MRLAAASVGRIRLNSAFAPTGDDPVSAHGEAQRQGAKACVIRFWCVPIPGLGPLQCYPSRRVRPHLAVRPAPKVRMPGGTLTSAAKPRSMHSQERRCGLTPRSRRGPTARQPARRFQVVQSIILPAGGLPRRRSRLTSNVRPSRECPRLQTFFSVASAPSPAFNDAEAIASTVERTLAHVGTDKGTHSGASNRDWAQSTCAFMDASLPTGKYTVALRQTRNAWLLKVLHWRSSSRRLLLLHWPCSSSRAASAAVGPAQALTPDCRGTDLPARLREGRLSSAPCREAQDAPRMSSQLGLG